MSGFEYIFTFYGLLLGLAVANATTNLAEMWRSRGSVGVGLAPPLLCVFILLAAAQQWVSFWGARDVLTMSTATLLMSLGMAMPYIFVSHGMTPAREGSGSFEAYYIAHRRTLMSVLAVPPVLSMAYNLVVNLAPGQEFTLFDLAATLAVVTAPRVLIPIWLAWTPSPRQHVLGLALLIAHTLVLMFL